MEQGRWNEAMSAFQIALEEGSEPGITHYYLCVASIKTEKYPEALHHIERALAVFPDKADFLSERGVIYFHLKKPGLALLDMDLALDLEPENPYRYSSRAYIKDALGDTAGAVADYEKAVELDPNDGIAWNNLGMLQEKLGHQQKAEFFFKRADELSGISITSSQAPVQENKPSAQDSGAPKRAGMRDYWKVMKAVFTVRDDRKAFWNYLLQKTGIRR
jgi:Flp pilus assembly protein TadD